MTSRSVLCHIQESCRQQIQTFYFLIRQIVLSNGHIALYHTSVRSILPRRQPHVRFLGIGPIVNNLCCRLMAYGIVHHILNRLVERLRHLALGVIVAATLSIDVRYLLIVATLRGTYLADAIQQVLKVVSTKRILSLQPLIVQHKALLDVFLQHLASP